MTSILHNKGVSCLHKLLKTKLSQHRYAFCFSNSLLICLRKYKYLNQNGSDRSSRPEVFYEEGVLRNFAKFTGKHLCQSLYFNKVAGLRHRPKNTFFCRTPPVAASGVMRKI